MVTKTVEEWHMMTPAEQREHLAMEEKNVFGFDVKHDRHGHPIEQGLGSPGNLTRQHLEAIKVYYKGPDKEQLLVETEAALIEQETRQAEERRAEAKRVRRGA